MAIQSSALRRAVGMILVAALAAVGLLVMPATTPARAATETVTFDANGGSGSMDIQVSSVPTALTANAFTRPGYSFSGWNTQADGSGIGYADGATYDFASSTTLFARWDPLPLWTVTFDANGGSGWMADQVANIPTALTANAFTHTGFTFDGWNTQADGNGAGYSEQAEFPFDASVTLYAQWKSLPDQSVTFDANGGSGSMADQLDNVPAILQANQFSRPGYVFDGWNTDPNGAGTAYADQAEYPFDASVTLYAQWRAVPTPTPTTPTPTNPPDPDPSPSSKPTESSRPGPGANLRGADLRGADLSGRNLRGADLSFANLRRAKLTGANLRGAKLTRANLKQAKLQRANLKRANLSKANLTGADLRKANVTRANFRKANLTKANFRKAKVAGAKFQGAKTAGTKGLRR